MRRPMSTSRTDEFRLRLTAATCDGRSWAARINPSHGWSEALPFMAATSGVALDP